MGAQARTPSGARRKKKGASKRAASVSAEERHRYYPDSVPPGMAAEVFDVSRIDEDGLEVLDDDEVEQEAPLAPRRRLSRRPPSDAPHPPRPSVRPRPLAPDDLRIDTPLSYASNPAAVLIDRAPYTSVAPPAPSGSGRALVFAAAGGIVVLLAGMVLGRRGDPPWASSPAEARHVTAPALEAAHGDERFSSARAAGVIDAAVARAKACRTSSTPGGPLVVRLMFAQTGQVVGVDVRGPLAGTAAGDCYAAALRGARVPAFEGGIASVDHTAVSF